MATVSKEIADKVRAGNGWYPGDNVRVVRIVEYNNFAGGVSYGLEYEGQGKIYTPSQYVNNPRVYWSAERPC